MDKKLILDTLEKAKKESKKRNFKQSVDLVLNIKGLNLKKPDNQLDFYITLHQDRGQENKVCALVPDELEAKLKDSCDTVIAEKDFEKTAKDKKLIKKIAGEHEYFVAIATIMPKVAMHFGKVLGPRGKMPNPKIGCVLPPTADIKPLYEKLQKTLRITIRASSHVLCKVGKEDDDAEKIYDNIMTIYNGVVSHLPNDKQNIKNACLKLTMGKAFKIEKTEKKQAK
ncbi:50S ribosomal protein L1 [Candidatus Woesearchaeota archaeon]|nr:50S ribosomal protein L1 [Candidatus Woesearchaeota archaeon]|tara:strand:+ start:4089 stop:4766 length:678 start_codon:yes stop_codon:yes gene_type:complete